ncbi:hypothetical protein [Luteolibacter soli]|uniref:Uncharacterized protein n=1 Tax=Luteolibacter soli TaxID=3135280 RepID=A0ABU9B526_9BACT
MTDGSADPLLSFDATEITRMEARWRLKSTAFTSALVGLLGELTGNGLTMEDFQDPDVRARLDQSLVPYQVGMSGFLDFDELLGECWDEAAELAREFHARSPMVQIVKKAAGSKDGSIASILNRYGLGGVGKGPVKASAIVLRPLVIRAIDAARVLRDKDPEKMTPEVNRLLDALVDLDRKILPTRDFEKMASEWKEADLQDIHESFGAAFLASVAGSGDLADLTEKTGGWGETVASLLPPQIEKICDLDYEADVVKEGVKRIVDADGAEALREAKEGREAKASGSGSWARAAIERSTAKAKERFMELQKEGILRKGRDKANALNSGTYSKDQEHTFTFQKEDYRKIIARVEKEFRDELREPREPEPAIVDTKQTTTDKKPKWVSRGKRASTNEGYDPALIDWVKILDDEIQRTSRVGVRRDFTKFRELIMDLVFLLADSSFASIGSASYGVQSRFSQPRYRRFGPVLTSLGDTMRQVRDGTLLRAGKLLPKYSPCNNLLMLDAIRRSWTDRQLELEHSQFMNDGKLRNPQLVTSMAQ